MNGHADCADILVQAGGVSTDGIRSMAAVSIQTAFRGHRCVRMFEGVSIAVIRNKVEPSLQTLLLRTYGLVGLRHALLNCLINET